MSVFMPSTTVTIQRGEAVDAFGDTTDVATSVATGVPALVTEGSSVINQVFARQVSYTPSQQRGGVLETYTIRLRPTVDVREQDRIVDERTGAVYQVVYVFNQQSIVAFVDVRVIANRVGAQSLAVNA